MSRLGGDGFGADVAEDAGAVLVAGDNVDMTLKVDRFYERLNPDLVSVQRATERLKNDRWDLHTYTPEGRCARAALRLSVFLRDRSMLHFL